MTLVTRRNHYIYQLHVNFLSVLGRFCRRPGELDKTTATGSFSETSQDNISDFWNILRNYRINYRLNQVGDWYHNKSLYIQYIYIYAIICVMKPTHLTKLQSGILNLRFRLGSGTGFLTSCGTCAAGNLPKQRCGDVVPCRCEKSCGWGIFHSPKLLVPRKLSERIQDFKDVPIFPSKNGGFKVPGSLSDWTHQRSCLSGVLWNLVS